MSAHQAIAATSATDRTPDAVFGMVLRQWRLEKGLTQEQLAWKTGIERAFISELERGVKGASINTLFRLANGLGIPPNQMIAEMELLLHKE